jgi:hypothetical protein
MATTDRPSVHATGAAGCARSSGPTAGVPAARAGEHRRAFAGAARAAATLLAVAGVVVPAHAQWSLVPRIEAEVIASDNVTLQPEDEAQADFVGVASPGFNLLRDDDRLRLALDYTLQAVGYAELSDGNEVFHQFDGQLATELVQDFLFVDLRSALYQQVVDPEIPFIPNNIVQTGNRANTWFNEINSSIRHDFSDFADLEASYSYGRQDFPDGDLIGTRYQQAAFALTSPAINQGVTWATRANYDRIEYSVPIPPAEFASLNGELGYWVGETVRVFATLGAESDFIAHPDRIEFDVLTWSVGTDWRVAERDQLTVTYGRRVFGNTFNASWQHQLTDTIALDIRYREQPSTNALQARAIRFDPPLEGGTEPPEGGSEVGLDRPGNTDVFVAKRFSAGLRLTGNRTTITLRGFSERRTDRVNTAGEAPVERDESSVGVAASWRWNAGVRTSLGLSAFAERARFASGTDTDRLNLNADARYDLSERTQLMVRLQRFQGETQIEELIENRIRLTFTRRFE